MLTETNIEPARDGVQVIARAAAILRALEAERQGLSLGEIAERLGLARSTVQRIVKALMDEQLVTAASARSGVKLGPFLMRLGDGARFDIVELATPYMRELAQEVGETVDLSVLSGSEALFIAQIAGRHRLSAMSRVGERFPLATTANGKALLAALSEMRRATLLARVVQDPKHSEALAEEIQDVMRAGVAFDREEHTAGVSAVGTWFLDPAGAVYALSIPTPAVRFGGSASLAIALLKVRDRLIEHLKASI